MTAKLTICQGLPCSGKSTWAIAQQQKHDGIVRVNRDTIREMLHRSEWTKANEAITVATRDAAILTALKKGRWVICDDTNLDPSVVRRLRSLAASVDPKIVVEVIFFDITADVAWERELKRREEDTCHVHVPKAAIDKMYKNWINKWQYIDNTLPNEPDYEPVEYVPGAHSAIMCDLDGTLAKIVARNPYDHMQCQLDQLDENVARVLAVWREIYQHKVILVSGRDDESRTPTMQWLEDESVEYDALYMRKHGDVRPDYIIKHEIFEEHIRGNYNVSYVLDDRDQVVNMWRKLGLVVWQVAPGDF